MNRLPDQHIVDRYMEAIGTLQYVRDYAGLDMFIHEDQKIDFSSYGLKANEYSAFVIGAAHFTKRIPTSVLSELIQQTKGKIVLVGGPAEQKSGESLCVDFPDRVINFCGQTDLQQSAFLVQQSRQVLTADTGMMHIAAAFHKKIIVLWGNTVPKFGMYPYYGNQEDRAIHFEVADLSCRPCSKIGFDACPKRHFDCMMKQDISKIVSVLNEA